MAGVRGNRVAAPGVNIIMTVKNGQPWIHASIQSVIQQSFQDWSMIIVDDGSTDDTAGILASYAQHDARIVCLPTAGIGRGPALNLALRHCVAPYVANLDADDLAHPLRLAIQVKFAKEHPEYALFSSDTVVFGETGEPAWTEADGATLQIVDVTSLLTCGNPINHSSILARRESIEKVGGYDQAGESQFDYDLWVRMAGAGSRLARIKFPLTAKRLHEGQFYGSSPQLAYISRSLRIQLRAMVLLKSGLKSWLYFMVRLIWALVPRAIRMRTRKILHG